MAWKPKEKALTAEEAVELAKKELEPFWIGLSPLIAAVRTENTVSLHPLSNDIATKVWLILFLDPTEYSGETCLHFAREWYRRYQSLGIHILCVYRPPYQFLRSQDLVTLFNRKQQITFPVAIDAEGLLSVAFGAEVLPKVVLLHQGKVSFESSGVNWADDTEKKIQDFLRISDPGLPLLRSFRLSKQSVQDVEQIEFGRNASAKVLAKFPAPGFNPATTLEPTEFKSNRRPDVMKLGEFFISGKWLQEDERVVTHDPSAVLGFRSSASRVSLIAQSLAKSTEMAKVVFEVNGSTVYEAIAGEALQMDEDGHSLVKVEGGNIYHALVNLPPEDREITIRFPHADRVPVGIYGIRLGD